MLSSCRPTFHFSFLMLLLLIVLFPFLPLYDPHPINSGIMSEVYSGYEILAHSFENLVCSIKNIVDWQGQKNPDTSGYSVNSVSKLSPPFSFLSVSFPALKLLAPEGGNATFRLEFKSLREKKNKKNYHINNTLHCFFLAIEED